MRKLRFYWTCFLNYVIMELKVKIVYLNVYITKCNFVTREKDITTHRGKLEMPYKNIKNISCIIIDITKWNLVTKVSNKRKEKMSYNQDKIDETVLATLLLTLHDENRAWKGHDFEVLDRLYEKGYIYNPKGKAKSVALTQEGLDKANEVFDKLFKD